MITNQIKIAKMIATSTKSTIPVIVNGITIGVVLANGRFEHVSV